MIRRVYIAGPYTGNEEENTKAAIAAGDALLAYGLYPYVPHLCHYWEQHFKHDYETWVDYNMEWLEQCNILLRLPGESKGADREVKLANDLDIPVYNSVEEVIKAHEEWLQAVKEEGRPLE